MNYQFKLTRLILICINVMIFLIGATLISQAIEIFLTRHFSGLTEFLPNVENVISRKNRMIIDDVIGLFLIVPGLIFLFLGFFGCSSIITQIPILLYSYFTIMGIVLIFQTLIIIFFISFRSRITNQFLPRLRRSILEEYQGPLEENLSSVSLLTDWMMYHLKCCGMESRHDFQMSMKWNRTNPWWNEFPSIENRYFKYPLTCCAINDSLHTNPIVLNRILSCAINGSDIYPMNCYEKFFNFIHSIQGNLIVFVLFLTLIELFGLMFVLIVFNRFQRGRISPCMEESPPSYSTTINRGHVYFQI